MHEGTAGSASTPTERRLVDTGPRRLRLLHRTEPAAVKGTRRSGRWVEARLNLRAIEPRALRWRQVGRGRMMHGRRMRCRTIIQPRLARMVLRLLRDIRRNVMLNRRCRLGSRIGTRKGNRDALLLLLLLLRLDLGGLLGLPVHIMLRPIAVVGVKGCMIR